MVIEDSNQCWSTTTNKYDDKDKNVIIHSSQI